MNNKKKLITFIIIAISAISIFGILLLSITSFYSNTSNNEDLIILNSKELKQSQIPNDIIIEDGDTSGYNVGTSYVFTKNIDKQKAVEALKDYLIYYDGKPVHTDSRIVININGNWVNTSVTYPDGQVRNISTGYKEIEAVDGVEFAAVSPFDFSRYACVIAKNSIESNYDVNKIPLKALTSRFTNLQQPSFDLNYNDSLNESNDIWSESYYRAGNGKYKSIMANVRILNDLTISGYTGIDNNDTYQAPVSIEPATEVEPVNQENPENINQIEEDNNSIENTIKQGIEDFKTNIENNDTFKLVTIIISTIIGIAVIYILFLIIRKIWHIIKR